MNLVHVYVESLYSNICMPSYLVFIVVVVVVPGSDATWEGSDREAEGDDVRDNTPGIS